VGSTYRNLILSLRDVESRILQAPVVLESLGNRLIQRKHVQLFRSGTQQLRGEDQRRKYRSCQSHHESPLASAIGNRRSIGKRLKTQWKTNWRTLSPAL